MSKLAFSRIGDGGRRGIVRTLAGPSAGDGAFHCEMPIVNGWSPQDYTAALTIKDRIVSVGDAAAAREVTRCGRARSNAPVPGPQAGGEKVVADP